MSLQMPNLDDRSFDDLLAEALKKISDDLDTSWNDFSPGDPGVVLLEAFSYLTEQMIYRLNRLPEKAYIAFLRMLGVGLKPPYAAHVRLSFWQDPPGKGTVSVPRGTRVISQPQGRGPASSQADGSEAIVFTTIDDLEVPDGKQDPKIATVLAYHATWQEEDLQGESNGEPGQMFMVAHPPILVSNADLNLQLGVEIQGAGQGDNWDTGDGRHFQYWQEVENFAGVGPKDRVYRVDRQAGIIQFAPATYDYLQAEAERKEAERQAAEQKVAEKVDGHNGNRPSAAGAKAGEKKALAAIPPKGCKIHVRYPTGGGVIGNIPVGVLTALRDPDRLPRNIKVSNLEPARGGMDAETLENALVRGPQEVFSQQRLITARDFERSVPELWPEIARARALALQDLWEHAQPGTVNIILVPDLRKPNYPTPESYTKIALDCEQARLDNMRGKKEKALEAVSPLGIRARLDWARYKRVRVVADVILSRGGDKGLAEKSLSDLLYGTISPLPIQTQSGWSFGAELHLAEVYRWILTCENCEKSIKRLQRLELKVDSAPDENIIALAVDYFQPKTWYAISGQRLFRTTNDAAGWEELLDFSAGKENPSVHLKDGMVNPPSGQTPKAICPSFYKAGLVALATREAVADRLRSYIYLSTDCGESWYRLADFNCRVEDMDWLQRAGRHILLLATSNGLEELVLKFDSQDQPTEELTHLIQVVDVKDMQVDPKTLAVNAVKVLHGKGGTARVAVAMDTRFGVRLSNGVDLSTVNGQIAFTELKTDSTDLLQRDIHCLGVQRYELKNSPDRYLLWAGGMATDPDDLRAGCCYWVFDDELGWANTNHIGRWTNKENWFGGSCLGLAFLGSRILAATARESVLWADIKPPTHEGGDIEITAWQPVSDPDDHLPALKTRIEGMTRTAAEQAHKRYIPFTAIATNDRCMQDMPPLVLAGCQQGVFRSHDRGQTFEKAAQDTFSEMKDKVTIPPNWLLVSGQHDIRVLEDDAAGEAGTAANGITREADEHEAG